MNEDKLTSQIKHVHDCLLEVEDRKREDVTFEYAEKKYHDALNDLVTLWQRLKTFLTVPDEKEK